MISELPFKSTIPELGKIIDGMKELEKKFSRFTKQIFQLKRRMTIRQSLKQILKVIKF